MVKLAEQKHAQCESMDCCRPLLKLINKNKNIKEKSSGRQRLSLPILLIGKLPMVFRASVGDPEIFCVDIHFLVCH